MEMMTPDPVEQQEPSAMDFIMQVIAEGNISQSIDPEALLEMSRQLKDDYDVDKESMGPWLKRAEHGIELAQLLKTDKTYPHAKAANIKFPLIANAALHYNARTYAAIVPSGNPVMAKINGNDDDGTKAARGERVTDYTAHQLREETSNWEEDMDRLTFIGPIVGTMFKKVWFDPAINETRTKLCVPGKVIVNHEIGHLDEAPAITEEISLQRHQIETRLRANLWADPGDKMNLPEDDLSKPVDFLEQHMRFDLDDDGYAEPYIVTMHVDSETIVRVVANFDMPDVKLAEDGQILAVRSSTYFVPYTFLPSFDGGFYGDGFGMLLGDVSDTINTTLNMIMDAGHYQAMPTGWIGGKDLRLKPGNQRFVPGEWRTINARGDDIRKGMVQMTMPEPSPVLFQMLGLMIDMGRELSSSKDIPAEAASQMTATTTMALVDQGERVYNASYKRLYRALSKEFKLMFKLNKGLDPEKYNAFFDDEEQFDPAEDFDLRGMDITPVADPKAVTNTQKAARAQFLWELAQGGMVDKGEAMKRVLRAMNIDDVEELLPEQTPQDKVMMEMQMLNVTLDLRLKAADIDKKMADTVKAIADAEAAEDGQQLGQYMQALGAMKMELENEQRRLGLMAGTPGNGEAAGPADVAGGAPGGNPEGPLV